MSSRSLLSAWAKPSRAFSPHGLRGWMLMLIGSIWAASACAARLTVAAAESALSLPIFVAESQGYFAAEGVDVRLISCMGGPLCLRMLGARTAQLVTASELATALAAFDDPQLAIVATLSTSGTAIRIVGRRSAGIDRSPLSLEGKRIGVLPATSSHYYLDSLLLANAIDPRRAALVPLARDQLVPALADRRIDAFAGYTNATAAALAAIGADAVLLDNQRLYAERFNLVADRRMLATQSDDVVKLLRALDRAQRFIVERPQQALDVLKSHMKVQGPDLQAAFDGTQYRLALDPSLVGAMESQARWALREGQVPAGRSLPNYRRYVESGPLRQAVPAALLP